MYSGVYMKMYIIYIYQLLYNCLELPAKAGIHLIAGIGIVSVVIGRPKPGGCPVKQGSPGLAVFHLALNRTKLPFFYI